MFGHQESVAGYWGSPRWKKTPHTLPLMLRSARCCSKVFRQDLSFAAARLSTVMSLLWASIRLQQHHSGNTGQSKMASTELPGLQSTTPIRSIAEDKPDPESNDLSSRSHLFVSLNSTPIPMQQPVNRNSRQSYETHASSSCYYKSPVHGLSLSSARARPSSSANSSKSRFSKGECSRLATSQTIPSQCFTSRIFLAAGAMNASNS